MSKNKSTSFLVELLVSTLVFSVACAILFSVFATAMLKARDTRNLSQANAKIVSMFEILREKEVEGGFPQAVKLETGDYVVYYDRFWNEATEEEADFSMVFQIRDEAAAPGSLRHINADVYHFNDADSDEMAILSMETVWYRRG